MVSEQENIDGGAAPSLLASLVHERDASRCARGEMPSTVPPDQTSERALADAIARSAQNCFGLPIFTENVTIARHTAEEITDLLPDRPLLGIVQNERDGTGVVALCPSTVAAIIEVQTLGRVSNRPLVERLPTRTDAAICSDFINDSILEITNALMARPRAPRLEGFRFASHLVDPRPLALMLDECGYAAIEMTIRLGDGGQRSGRISYYVPQSRDVFMPTENHNQSLTDAPQDVKLTAVRAEIVPVNLHLMIRPKPISLGALSALIPGSVLPLPKGCMEALRVESDTGQLLALGQIGENDGQRAVRLRPAHAVSSQNARSSESAGIAPISHTLDLNEAEALPDGFATLSADAPPDQFGAGECAEEGSAGVDAIDDSDGAEGVTFTADPTGLPMDDLTTNDEFRPAAGGETDEVEEFEMALPINIA